MTLLVAGHETTASDAGLGLRAAGPRARGAGTAAPRRSTPRRRRLPDGDDPGDAAPPAGAAQRRAAPGQASRSRSAAGPTRRASAWSPNAYLIHHDPDDLPRPLRLPARALPRRAARHLHLDPLRRRPAPLPRRQLRDAGDEDRAARRAVARDRARSRRRSSETPPARDHDQPAPRRADGARRGAAGAEGERRSDASARPRRRCRP